MENNAGDMQVSSLYHVTVPVEMLAQNQQAIVRSIWGDIFIYPITELLAVSNSCGLFPSILNPESTFEPGLMELVLFRT